MCYYRSWCLWRTQSFTVSKLSFSPAVRLWGPWPYLLTKYIRNSRGDTGSLSASVSSSLNLNNRCRPVLLDPETSEITAFIWPNTPIQFLFKHSPVNNISKPLSLKYLGSGFLQVEFFLPSDVLPEDSGLILFETLWENAKPCRERGTFYLQWQAGLTPVKSIWWTQPRCTDSSKVG